jgi:hypothetical protein
MTRTYLPTTHAGLRELEETGRLQVGVGYAATARLAAELDGLGDEETEFALSTAAAEASLDLLGDAGAERGRRVVVVADLDDAVLTEHVDAPGVLDVAGHVPLSAVDAILVDTTEVDVVTGDDSDRPLGWFATQELPDLLA